MLALFDQLAALADDLAAGLAGSLAVFIRVGAMMALLPGFGEQTVPVRIRLGLALAFTAITAPALAPDLPPVSFAPGPLLVLIVTESAAGLALGAVLRLMVIVLQTAGTMAAQATSLSQFFGGAGADPQPAMAQLLVMSGLALAMMAGLHVRLAELIVHSYTLFPPGRAPDATSLADWGVAHAARAFRLAFSLAMPFVILSLLYYVALGAINKAMPQLMVAFVGAPAITFGGLALLLLTAPLMLPLWQEAFHTLLADPGATPR